VSIDWNAEKWPEKASPEIKGLQFDLTYEQNQANSVINNCTNPPHFPPHCGCPAG
jgi:hypothetical protein